jgi:probable rRNA maturation factor
VSYTIEIADEQPQAIDRARLKKAVRGILHETGIESAEISIAIVTDERMHALNRQYLQHDYPTDVLSFVLEYDEEANSLDGEIIASRDYAAREAQRYGWTTDDELLLYVIHGCLHLVGHDDTTFEGKQAMRVAETQQLAKFGLQHRFDADG